MIGYRFISPALEEAGEAAEYYAEVSTSLGQDELENKIKFLRSFPMVGTPTGSGCGRRAFRGFPSMSCIISIRTD
jgi:hypothetical protein